MLNNGKLKHNRMSKGQMGKILKDFCESTSLHGYSYLYTTETIEMKLIWIFMILIMTGLGFVFVTSNTKAYFKARLVTNIESSTADLSVSVHISYPSFNFFFIHFLYHLECCFSFYNYLQFKSSTSFIHGRFAKFWKLFLEQDNKD